MSTVEAVEWVDVEDEVVVDVETESDQEPEKKTWVVTTTEAIDDSERRFWMELDLLGKISECSREIEESEATIDRLKIEAKEAKEYLKGQDILLRRLSSKLRDVIAGKPLPIDPSKPPEEVKIESESEPETDENEGVPNADWASVTTQDLLAQTKGIGKAKLEAICDLTPTAGDLEKLRGQASLEHKSFREMLPKGCGQAIADAIEDELINLVAECSAKPDDDGDSETDVIDEL